jgi:hypothetical protein
MSLADGGLGCTDLIVGGMLQPTRAVTNVTT